jgi:hypothetical protein
MKNNMEPQFWMIDLVQPKTSLRVCLDRKFFWGKVPVALSLLFDKIYSIID